MRLLHHMRSNPHPDAERDTDTERDLGWVVVGDAGEHAKVLVHNDDVTPYDFVIVILRAVFGLPPAEAERVTLRAHVTGVAHVMTLPVEEAKHRVGRAHATARRAGFPLSFTIEIEPAP